MFFVRNKELQLGARGLGSGVRDERMKGEGQRTTRAYWGTVVGHREKSVRAAFWTQGIEIIIFFPRRREGAEGREKEKDKKGFTTRPRSSRRKDITERRMYRGRRVKE